MSSLILRPRKNGVVPATCNTIPLIIKNISNYRRTLEPSVCSIQQGSIDGFIEVMEHR